MVHHHFTLRRRVKRRVTLLRRCIKRVVDRLLMSCLGKPVRYRVLPVSAVMTPNQTPSSTFAPSSSSSPKSRELLCRPHHQNKSTSRRQNPESKDDLVALKISLLGDSQIGKTSFLVINLPNLVYVHGTNSYIIQTHIQKYVLMCLDIQFRTM